MKLCHRLIDQAKNCLKERYMTQLLLGKIRLVDIPTWLLTDCRHTRAIHIAAFRVDRGISQKRYKEDLIFVEVEIALARGRKDLQLQAVLEWIRDHAESSMDLIREKGEE